MPRQRPLILSFSIYLPQTKIRRCSEYIVGRLSGIRAVRLRNLPMSRRFLGDSVARFRFARPRLDDSNLSQSKRSFIQASRVLTRRYFYILHNGLSRSQGTG